jgi:DNA topoisomerase VI subunit B
LRLLSDEIYRHATEAVLDAATEEVKYLTEVKKLSEEDAVRAFIAGMIRLIASTAATMAEFDPQKAQDNLDIVKRVMDADLKIVMSSIEIPTSITLQ